MIWLTLDPGENTGWSLWKDTTLIESGQDPLWDVIDRVDATLVGETAVTWGETVIGDKSGNDLEAIVCEDWVLYEWMATKLVWDKFRTVRGIGAFTLLARQHNIPFILQGANIKAAAVAAGAEELFRTPLHENRHQNDAIMHGVYYLALNDNVPPGERRGE